MARGSAARSRIWPRFVSAELHRNVSLFAIAFLLVHGKLPTRVELDGYKLKLKSLRGLPAAVRAALETLPAAAHRQTNAIPNAVSLDAHRRR